VNFIEGTIARVREIVIVIADLYFPPGSTEAGEAAGAAGSHAGAWTAGAASPAGIAHSGPWESGGARSASVTNATAGSPGLAHIARFGRRRALEGEGGWRAWLARRLGRDDLMTVPPAVIAATVLDQRRQTGCGTLPSDTASGSVAGAQSSPASSAGLYGTPTASASAPGAAAALTPADATPTVSDRPLAGAPTASAPSTFWLATPLYRIAGLTTLHLDRRSLLHLAPEEADAFVIDFNRTFGDDPTFPLRLSALPGGALLLEAPATMTAATTDPARALVQGLEASMPRGPHAIPFKRLSAEVEMWLHEHPLNTFRNRRGELPVNAFWFWGGGAAAAGPIGALAPGPQPTNVPGAPQLFGSDPYLAGLSHLTGLPLSALPNAFLNSSHAQPTVLLTEIGPLLHANPAWSVFDAVAALDQRFTAPAVAALHTGAVERLTLIANDMELKVRRHDRLKFWRRSKPELVGLQ
jgi:hypothetical protein